MTKTLSIDDLAGKFCEVCQSPATRAAMDIIEIEPVDGWEQWEAGDIHYGCAEHEAQATATMLDGTVTND